MVGPTLCRQLSVVAACLAALVVSCDVLVEPPLGVTVSCATETDCQRGEACLGSPPRCLAIGDLDRSPVALVSPEPGAVVLHEEVTLVWRGVSHAASYEVFLARDPDLVDLVRPPTRVTSGENALAIAGLTEAVTLYWAVKSDITAVDAPHEARALHVLTDAVYVYCPADVACGNAGAEEVGNTSHPFQSVQAGIDAATRYGLPVVRVAGRGNQAAYSPGASITGGLSLVGGYAPNFETKDVALYPTLLADSQNALRVIATQGDTVVAGFSMYVDGTNTAPFAVGVRVSAAGARVKLEDVEVTVTGGEQSDTGILIDTSHDTTPRVVVERTSVHVVGTSPSITGVKVIDSTAEMEHLAIDVSGGSAATVVGVQASGSNTGVFLRELDVRAAGGKDATGVSAEDVRDLELTNSRVRLTKNGLGAAARRGKGVSARELYVGPATASLVANNTIVVEGSALAIGVDFFALRGLAANNIVVVHTCANEAAAVAVRYIDGARLMVAHNTLLLHAATVSAAVVQQEHAEAAEIRNNVAATYGTCQAVVGARDVDVGSVVTQGNTYSNDILLTSTEPTDYGLILTASEAFADLGGVDADVATPEDGDLRLAAVVPSAARSAQTTFDRCLELLGTVTPGHLSWCDLLLYDAAGTRRPDHDVGRGAFEP